MRRASLLGYWVDRSGSSPVIDRERQTKDLEQAEMKELAAANKLYNEKIAEEKRAAAAKAKEVRDRAKAEERAAIDARKEQGRKIKEARDSAKALKLSQRGNCTTSRSSTVKQHPKPVTPPPPRPTITIRSGRTATKYQ